MKDVIFFSMGLCFPSQAIDKTHGFGPFHTNGSFMVVLKFAKNFSLLLMADNFFGRYPQKETTFLVFDKTFFKDLARSVLLVNMRHLMRATRTLNDNSCKQRRFAPMSARAILTLLHS